MKRAKILADLIEEKWGNKSAFAKNIGMAPTTLQSILTRGVGKSSVDNIVKVCKGLGITSDILEKLAEQDNWKSEILPLKTKRVPLLGDIAAGEPIMAEDEYGAFVEVGCGNANKKTGVTKTYQQNLFDKGKMGRRIHFA